MKIGNRLLIARQDRQLNQAEMADLLGISSATYSRLERNDTSIDIDQMVDFANKLEIPIQDFLPETISINNNNQDGHSSHIGLVIGDINHYSDKEMRQTLALKEQEISFLKKENSLLANEIDNLKKIIGLMNEKK